MAHRDGSLRVLVGRRLAAGRYSTLVREAVPAVIDAQRKLAAGLYSSNVSLLTSQLDAARDPRQRRRTRKQIEGEKTRGSNCDRLWASVAGNIQRYGISAFELPAAVEGADSQPAGSAQQRPSRRASRRAALLEHLAASSAAREASGFARFARKEDVLAEAARAGASPVGRIVTRAERKQRIRALAERLLPDTTSPRRRVISMHRAQELFLEMSRQRLGYRYPDEYCVDRAHLATAAMARQGIAAHKVQVWGDLWARTPNHLSGRIRWQMHIAPAVTVRLAAGATVEMVLDPSVADRPLQRKEWLKLLHAGPDSSIYRVPGNQLSHWSPRASGWSVDDLVTVLERAAEARHRERVRQSAVLKAVRVPSSTAAPR